MENNNAPDNISGKTTGTKGGNNDYSNEMSSGTVGAEGGNDNGASTLRALKKKHANDGKRQSPDSSKHIL